MKMLLQELPTEHEYRADWLEQQIVGLDLYDLVVQLRGIYGDADEGCSLDELLGKKLADVLASGLKVLSPSELSRLLANPETMIELQEQVFLDGGEYWQSRDLPAEARRRTLDIRAHVTAEAFAQHQASATLKPKDVKLKRWQFSALLTAAAIILIFVSWQNFLPQPSPIWGFANADINSSPAMDADYMVMLADAASDWFDKVPTDDAALLTRIDDFVAGCEQLVAADHLQLSDPIDRVWLRDKCQSWANKLVAVRGQVVSKQIVFRESRQQANQVIRDLRSALRSRADEIATRSGRA